ncbi:type II secretion system protein [Dechloromonas sp. ARDL1]|uniref:type II secretion system protein n=1 Tax=Dechloromonas sp. ARDL1 TaxID=3322121 RepID=UPI003DA734B9
MGEERKNGQKGTTLIELVIGIIVLGILASIAWPSWVSVKSEAGAVAAERTKESLKAKWLAARNDHDRGAADEPTLGRLVGYKAAVPPAPATIPMLLDYSYHLEPDWWGHMYAIDLNNTGSEGWNTVKSVPWSGQITCMGSNNMFLETAWAPVSPSAGFLSY